MTRIKLVTTVLLGTMLAAVGPTLFNPGQIRGGTSGRVLYDNGSAGAWTAAPSGNTYLEWNGSAYVWSSGTSGGTLAGDVTGTIGSNTLSKIDGTTLNGSSPVPGQILEYDGTAWDLDQRLYLDPVVVCTTAALPSDTYNNGSSGVGATLTANANGALTVDGQAVSAGWRVLVNNESNSGDNGIYTVTLAGSSTSHWQLTRAYDFNQASNLTSNKLVGVIEGTTYCGSMWEYFPDTTSTPVVGTSGGTFVLAAVRFLAGGTNISISGSLSNTINVTAAGSNSQVQYNSSGSLGADAGMTYGGQGGSTLLGLTPTGTTATALKVSLPSSYANGTMLDVVDSSSDPVLVSGVGSSGNTYLWLINPSATASGIGGGGIRLGTGAYQTSGNTIGGFTMGMNPSNTWDATAHIFAWAAENQSSGHWGSYLTFGATKVGTTTLTDYWRLDGAGNGVFNNTGSAIATSATDGFVYIPSSSGNPSGSPTSFTGATPIEYDNSNGGFWINGGAWAPIFPTGATTVSGNLTVGSGGGSSAAGAIGYVFVSATGKTVTLPSALSLAGKCLTVKNTFESANSTTVKVTSGGGTIEGVAGTTGVSVTSTASDYAWATFTSDGTNWWKTSAG